MGVTFSADGLSYEDSYDCGYATVWAYRSSLATAVNPVAGAIYEAVASGEMREDDDGHVIIKLGCITDASGRELGTEEVADWLGDMSGRIGDIGFDSPYGMGGTMVRTSYEALNALFVETYGKDLASFLLAPDCEGVLEPDECAGILRDLEALGNPSPHVTGHNYGEVELRVTGGRRQVTMREYDMHSQFLGMFRHCEKQHVPLRWC